MRQFAVSGLSAALAGLVVLAIHGAGSVPVISLGGLAIAAIVFGWIVMEPTRFALAPPSDRT